MIILAAKIGIIVTLLRINLMTGGFGFLSKAAVYAIACIVVGLAFSAHHIFSEGAFSGMVGIIAYISYVSVLSVGFFYGEEKLGSTVFRLPVLILGGAILVFLT